MGGWISVSCNCVDRRPSDGSPHGRTYACGHDHGELAGMPLYNVLLISGAIQHAFGDDCGEYEVFIRIGNMTNYHDELYALIPDDGALWRMEIEQLQQQISNSPPMDYEIR